MTLELAGLIVLGIFGVCFFLAVWVLARRGAREDEPPPRQ